MEAIKVKGSFCMQVLNADGTVKEEYLENNLVVTIGKTNLTKLLGGDTAGKAVTKIAVGTNGVAPALTDTNITSAYTKAIDSVEYPDATSVKFNFHFGTTEANGMTIREAGLILDDNSLFARKVRTDYVKTSANPLSGYWIIQFI
jgi:hypothetical protein